MNARTYLLLLMVPLMGTLAGCAGTQTFGTAARAGDTVVLPVGWLNLKSQNLNVSITPSSGPAITNVPVRGVVNLYPDPSSKLMIGFRTKQDLGSNDWGIGKNINAAVTADDREWWQTAILLDLPASLPTGTATVHVTDSAGNTIYPVNVTVLPGTGLSNLFNIYTPFTNGQASFDFLNTYPSALKSMETADRYAVTFSGQDANGNDIIPHSIQLQFTHTSGVGVACVVDPVAYLKSAVWLDDGNGNLKVMLTPAKGNTLAQTLSKNGLVQFKFYIAGGITGLTQTSLKAYDINGSPLTGITATVTPQ
ncbi:hypothetical protein SCD_n00113 [Sulfuricella denitrificans skB26]|uniref:Lipoprotein n=1 Tax=Sulfuricella denitrificans (strain DSM 22764 / NBRC 105220 / skB26) TaxID=1163617 RepID=S6AZM3_SULDS|nr:hypothetical protein [Sulfuricella denitrificans]BAN33962.1 hypothetical protein SCD_n00113 [Sulfuricella denitrificans skB26]